MKYQGSKRRLAKDIIPILIKDRKPGQYFIDIFCGSCSIIKNIDSPRIASDSNFYLIEMWKALQNGWLPKKNYTEEEYNDIKNNKDMYYPWLVGYVGFCLSYAGKWFGGWCRDGLGKRKYDEEAYRNISKDIPLIKDIDFRWCDYKDLKIPPNSIIYCDPPYYNTTKYNTKFEHYEFWSWCRFMVGKDHQLFISEYAAPPDFNCVWQKEIVSSLTKDTGSKTGVEKLFIYKDFK